MNAHSFTRLSAHELECQMFTLSSFGLYRLCHLLLLLVAVSGCHSTELVNCGGSYGDRDDVCNCCRCVLNHLPFAAAFLQRSVLSAVSLLTETSSIAIAYLFMIFSKNVQVCEY